MAFADSPSSTTPGRARVAIITRTKNRPLFLPRFVGSVLAQTFRDWVHVVVNDGGDAADLEARLEPYRADYRGRLVVVHHERSLGMQPASNTGITNSDSDFIVIHDDDDSWDPRFLEATVRKLSAVDPALVGGVITQIRWIREDINAAGEVTTRWSGPYLPVERVSAFEAFWRNPTAPIAFLYRRSLHAELGLYDPRWDALGDWDFLLRILAKYEVTVVPEVLANYHWRAETPSLVYANTVTEGLRHHLNLRNRLRNEAIRRSLAESPASQGLYWAVAEPLLKQQEDLASLSGKVAELSGNLSGVPGTLDIVNSKVWELSGHLGGVPGAVEVLNSEIKELSGRLGEVSGRLNSVSGDIRELALAVQQLTVTVEGLAQRLRHVEEARERTHGRVIHALDYHSWILEEIRPKTENVYERLRRWEYTLTRNPKLKPPPKSRPELAPPDARDEAAREQAAEAIRQIQGFWPHMDVLSVDIFDTALIRGCGFPTTVFDLLEDQVRQVWPACGAGAFRSLRVQAEAEARRRYQNAEREDITLAEIYRTFGDLNGLAGEEAERLMAWEIEIEARLCQANRTILGLVQRALADRKRVFFVSDMYLPVEALAGMLRGAGYPECPILVSSAHGKTKASGRLYRVLLEQAQVGPARVVHVGDNRASDVVNARAVSIRAVWWQGSPAGLPFADQQTPEVDWNGQELASRLAVGLAKARRLNLPKTDDAFWENVGYEVAGPLYVNFAAWTLARARADGARRLFLLARDGYYLQEVFGLLSQSWQVPVSIHYLYASRRLFNLARANTLDVETLRFLLSPNPGLRVRDFLSRINLDAEAHQAALGRHGFHDLDEVLTNRQGRFHSEQIEGRLREFFLGVRGDVEAMARAERSQLLEYFADVGFEAAPDVAIVDIGWQASLLRSLQQLLRLKDPGFRLRGYYFATWHFARPVLDEGALLQSYFLHLSEPEVRRLLLHGSVEAIEFFFSAPYGSIIGIEKGANGWQPITGTPENDATTQANLKRMHEAALRYARDFVELRPPAFVYQQGEGYLDATLRRFFKNPSREEAARYGALGMRDSFGDRTPVKHLAKLPRLPIFGKVGAIQRAYEQSYWEEGLRAQLPTWLRRHLD